MEKSLGYGFEYYMDLIPGMKQADPKASSSIVLAYIGDCVFDLIIKMRVVGRGGLSAGEINRCINCMKRQAGMCRRLLSLL